MEVLLVEADALVREMLAEEFADAEFDVVTAPCAKAATSILERTGEAGRLPIILVTAMGLGEGADGLALAAEVRRRWPDVLIIITAGVPARPNDDGPREVWLRLPVGPTRLTATVNELMYRHRP